MHIAILGAGAMGSWFGGQLALQGHPVQLLTTNKDHINAITEQGLTLHESGNSARVRVVNVHASLPSDYDGSAELIIVLTKSYQTHTAMQSIAPYLENTTAVLSLQNGLGNAEAISAFLPVANIWIGMSMMPVDKLAAGIVASRGAGQTRFGRLDGTEHPLTVRIESAFQKTGMDICHDPDVLKRIWEKVAFNAGMNSLCALSHGTPGTIGQLPEAFDLVRQVALEVAAVAEAEGVSIGLEAVYNTIAYACENHGGHKASMLQDLLSAKRTEVDALNGAIVSLGAKNGVQTPLNTVLATLIRLAELGHHSPENNLG